MVYQSNFVATVKVGGKILRENKDTVALPFGSEYSILMKNQNSVRALVRVTLDGQPVSDVADGWFIVGANQTVELERFIRNGNFNEGNRFKFIERTGAIENHRGIGVDDGLVRVEYKFEVPQQVTSWLGGYTTVTGGLNSQVNYQVGNLSNADSFCYNVSNVTNTTPTNGTVTSNSVNFQKSYDSNRVQPSYGKALRSATKGKPSFRSGPSGQSRSLEMNETALNDAGITVAGSKSNQKFSWGGWFPTETTSHVIVLKLVGKVGEKTLIAPVTVKAKPVCSSCGRTNKATSKFCAQCGTALELF